MAKHLLWFFCLQMVLKESSISSYTSRWRKENFGLQSFACTVDKVSKLLPLGFKLKRGGEEDGVGFHNSIYLSSISLSFSSTK